MSMKKDNKDLLYDTIDMVLNIIAYVAVMYWAYWAASH